MPEVESEFLYPIMPLGERVKVILDYLQSGHEWQIEGRTLVLIDNPPYRVQEGRIGLAAKAETMVYEKGKLVKQAEGLISFNISLTRFLTLAQAVSYGDLVRMRQIASLEGMK